MRFQSTRDAAYTVGLGAAIARGLAPDGGLYVPQSWPTLPARRMWTGAAEVGRVSCERKVTV